MSEGRMAEAPKPRSLRGQAKRTRRSPYEGLAEEMWAEWEADRAANPRPPVVALTEIIPHLRVNRWGLPYRPLPKIAKGSPEAD
jgi:hypothetical protein